MNDITFNWTKLSKMLLTPTTLADRSYTKEEINSILKLAEVREKIVISYWVSGGIRLGAFTELLVKHATPVIIDNVLIVIIFLPPFRLVFFNWKVSLHKVW